MLREDRLAGGDSARVLVALSYERERMVVSHWVASLGYEVVPVDKAGQLLAEAERPGTVYAIIDEGFDGGHGFELATRTVQSDAALPVLLLVDSRESPGPDKIFNGGLDDFLVRPLDVHELMGRVRQRLRLASGGRSGLLTCGPFCIDRRTQRVWAKGQRLKLSPIPHRILRLLMDRSPQTVPNEDIGASALDWVGNPGQVRKQISKLRDSLRPLGLNKRIVTVNRRGYRIEPTIPSRLTPHVRNAASPPPDAPPEDVPPASSRNPRATSESANIDRGPPPSER